MLVYHLGGAGGTIPEKSRTKCLSMMDGLNVDLGSWTVRIVLRVLYFSEQLITVLQTPVSITSPSCTYYFDTTLLLLLAGCVSSESVESNFWPAVTPSCTCTVYVYLEKTKMTTSAVIFL